MWLKGWLFDASITLKMSTPIESAVLAKVFAERDVHIAIRRFGKLGELGRLGGTEIPDTVGPIKIRTVVEVENRLVELDCSCR